MSALLCPAAALVQLDPDFLARLSPAELLAARYDYDLWLRPDQRIPRGKWRSYGLICGRGFGKTFGISIEINRRVEAGECRSLALAAPTLERVRDVQSKNLIDASPPWFKAEPYRKDSVRWPNGMVAETFAPEAPGRPRSGNFDLAWMTELVDWQGAERLELHHNIATGTRAPGAQILWDTTSKGKNEIIQHRMSEHERDPKANLMVRGQLFDNPLLERRYIEATCAQYAIGSQRYAEEVLGLVFAESAGALWRQEWIDSNRVQAAPSNLELIVVALDPSMSDSSDADDAGIAVVGRARRSEDLYVLDDLSGKMTPEAWARVAVERCAVDASGISIETNHVGQMGRQIIKALAAERGMSLSMLGKHDPFPPRVAGRIYLREHCSATSKATRAEAPAGLYQRRKVHHVGTHALLEQQQTTWTPDTKKSPNRLDALVFGVIECADLRTLGKTDHTQAASAARAAHAALNQSLTVRARAARIGI